MQINCCNDQYMLIKYAHEYNDIREAKEYMEMRKMSGIGTISSCLNLRYKNYLLGKHEDLYHGKIFVNIVL